MNNQQDFQRWLSSATRGLPSPIKSMICDELAAHYDDAFAEQRGLGLLPVEAHRAVLAQLGSPHATRRALCAVHLARRQFLWAAVVTMISLVEIIIGALFAFQPLLFTLFGIGCGMYVLESLRKLLESPRTSARVGTAITMIEIGLLGAAAFGTLGILGSYQYPIIIVFADPLVLARFDPYLQPLTFVHFILALSIIMNGSGWLLLADILGVDAPIHFRGLLRSSLLVNGLGLVGLSLGILIRNSAVIIQMGLVLTIAGLFRQAFLVLIFVRAARQSSNNPWRGSHA
ncbi:MAG: hypothetical protein KJ065_00430 [Anaerolineae bacterium]|nr:hypothetical protein [Anaerolineae bacterium]